MHQLKIWNHYYETHIIFVLKLKRKKILKIYNLVNLENDY